MSVLEMALRELEVATAAASALSLDDTDAADAILRRRAEAIASLASLQEQMAALPAAARDELVNRLRLSMDAGDEAIERLARARRLATAEWSRWNQVRRALGAESRPGASHFDCQG